MLDLQLCATVPAGLSLRQEPRAGLVRGKDSCGNEEMGKILECPCVSLATQCKDAHWATTCTKTKVPTPAVCKPNMAARTYELSQHLGDSRTNKSSRSASASQ